MTASTIRQKYLAFFKAKDHQIIPPAPLVPADDPTTLFTNSGMQPLVPYLKGQIHPMCRRLVDSQPCFRAEDIDEVGDNRHTTFFEMLGNWSLGDYFKQDQLPWFWEFLTHELKLPKARLYISLFKGSSQVPRDQESLKVWKKLGVPENKIYWYEAKKNWWSRAGTPEEMPEGEIGGPTSEVFFEFDSVDHNTKYGKACHPNCDCGRFLEIGNTVFMEYEKTKQGLKKLPAQNVDFGGGLERLTAASQNQPDIFQIELFSEAVKNLEVVKKSGPAYNQDPLPYRVIVDHLRAAVFMAAGGVEPSNKDRGYILRRLIRRSMVQARKLGMEQDEWLSNTLPLLASPYTKTYPLIDKKIPEINQTITQEIDKFRQTITRGLKEFNKTSPNQINERFAFKSLATYGMPFEITQELAQQRGIKLDKGVFDEYVKKHQDLSRTVSTGMFKGGLADHSEATTKLHTATHLLHAALKKVLGDHVRQEGSHITAERLRFDFAHPRVLADEEIKKVEDLVNQKITEDLPVKKTIEAKNQALKSGAMAFFKETYPDKVTVYTVGRDLNQGWFSKEFCGGPHVTSTGKIGSVRIYKQKNLGAGLRRLYARLNHGNHQSIDQNQGRTQ